MKRSLSQVTISEAFPRLTEDTMEEELSEISKKIVKKDKRHLASILGAGALSLLGIAIFASTLIGAVGGGVLGFLLGHALGRKWNSMRIFQSLPSQQRYRIRLSCLVLYLRSLKRSGKPISYISSQMEKVISEFRPALVLQFNDPAIMKEVRRLANTLRNGFFHILLLKNLTELKSFIKEGLFPSLCIMRLRNCYMPALFLLKTPQKNLEFVFRMEKLLSNSNVRELLDLFSVQDTSIIEMLIPNPKLSLEASGAMHRISRNVVDLDIYFTCKSRQEPLPQDFTNRKAADMLRNRRLSLHAESSEFPHIKDRSSESLGLTVLQALSPFSTQPQSCKQSASVCEDQFLNVLKYAASQQHLSPVSSCRFRDNDASPLNILFDGDFGDIEATSNFTSSSEEEEEEPFISRTPVFESDFRVLLEIEQENTDADKWTMTVNKPGTRIYQKKSGESPICMIKAFCEINYSADTVLTAIWDPDIRTQWDDLFKEFKVIDKQTDCEVLYYMIKTPFGITKRDWLQRRIFVRDYPDPGMIIMHFVSTEHPDMPPRKGVIRAETIISGYILRPVTESSCTVTIISQNDIKGLIPKVLVNKAAAKAPADWVNNMNKGCRLVAGY